MDTGQTISILSQLILGAIASFLGILLWSKTRELTWMLIIIAALVSYIEIIYIILGHFGIGNDFILIDTIPLFSIILPSLRMSFFIAAFILIIIKHFRKKNNREGKK